MEAKQLLGLIDQEINMNVRNWKRIDASKLVDSYQMEEEYKPIITEYVEKVNDLLQIRYEQAKEYSWPMSILGLIGSSAIGTGIGALVGYFTDGINGAKSFAAWGAAMGALFEFMFHPTYTFLSYKYIRSEIKSFKEPVITYKNQALSKLESLVQ
ncbi:glycine zipper family protein [Candidatus Woesearchaeota archaeon]|nr:glycine zipper family protein [Candidatus Woesearchaeota archaeon]